ncbi:hypothetical protein CI109_102100 [Kwoniella shandongensis]|uniref:Uncharacterized protein n=1 Tax=Kwoniella shandongensis TaxID=1734106 RepID=A0A5M6BSR4_9TREE|nr:uncharacterized protein CI109_005871 [Kwoniella shandongensis]KAA5525847.1 hypothetical protein CI109_005871 [Kwoniella shandongensis]
MPSLLSKFRHRKTPSTSSANSSAPPSPTSPASRQQQQASPVQTSSPTFSNSHNAEAPTPTRQGRSKLNESGPPQLPPIGAASGFGVGSGGGPIDRSDEDVVLIDKASPSSRDETGHRAPFVDESERPELPTTSSNVNNPPPSSSAHTQNFTSPSSLLSHQAPGAVPGSAAKPLPPVPETRSAGQHLSAFPNPPHNSGLNVPGHDDENTPHVPPRSPERSSISGLPRDGPSPPPMPHVTSVNRGAILGSGDDRPGIVPSSSRPPRSDEQGLQGGFAHVDSVRAGEHESHAGHRNSGGRRSVDVPQRGTSLNPRRAARLGRGNSSDSDRSSYSDQDNDDSFPRQGQTGTGANQDYDSSSVGGAAGLVKPFQGIQLSSDKHHNSAQSQSHAGYTQARMDLLPKIDPELTPSNFIAAYLARLEVASGFAPVSSSLDKSTYIPEPHNPVLEAERLAMVEKLLNESSRRRAERGVISEQGRSWFRNVGLEGAISKPDTVDVETQWLEPVVKELIIRKEINEYCIVINREIHKYHIYPKIQPIHDTDPIRLPTLHRIFSPTTGKWHEVEGDAAAIEILGRETFNNGPKAVREVRRPALPGLEPTGGQRGGISALKQGAKRVLGGGLTGRILEREYPVGGKETDWRVVRRHPEASLGSSRANVDGSASRAAAGHQVGMAL